MAQLVLPPKPKKAVETKPAKHNTGRYERGIIGSIPAKGWHGEVGIGGAIWGAESQCRCNALTADAGFFYVGTPGFLVGSQLLLTNTISRSFSPTLKIGYQHVRKADKSIGEWSVNVMAGPSLNYGKTDRFIGTEAYSGFIYGGELSFQPRLGKYSQLRSIMAIGWLTKRETFTSDGWTGPTETRMKHSGLRFRFGITI